MTLKSESPREKTLPEELGEYMEVEGWLESVSLSLLTSSRLYANLVVDLCLVVPLVAGAQLAHHELPLLWMSSIRT